METKKWCPPECKGGRLDLLDLANEIIDNEFSAGYSINAGLSAMLTALTGEEDMIKAARALPEHIATTGACFNGGSCKQDDY